MALLNKSMCTAKVGLMSPFDDSLCFLCAYNLNVIFWFDRPCEFELPLGVLLRTLIIFNFFRVFNSSVCDSSYCVFVQRNR